MKVNTEKTFLDGDFQALTLEAQRLDNLAKCEQQLTKQAAESCSQWEAQARLSEDKARVLQEENLNLKQSSFVANMSASSLTAEAELVVTEANAMLGKVVEAMIVRTSEAVILCKVVRR